MSDEVRAKIEKLQADYQEVVGRPFNHFYCPILFQDKDVCLCKAHIVNQAFHNSSKAWTVQRKDVDSFFGSNFEADFVALQYARTRSPAEIFAQKDLHKKFDPKIVMDGKQVDYFIATGQIPKQFTAIEFEQEGRPVLKIGLKISPKAVVASVNSKWALDISKDMRIAAMVSLIKSAHLTLFEMLGYRYALSSGGEFVGRQILVFSCTI